MKTDVNLASKSLTIAESNIHGRPPHLITYKISNLQVDLLRVVITLCIEVDLARSLLLSPTLISHTGFSFTYSM